MRSRVAATLITAQLVVLSAGALTASQQEVETLALDGKQAELLFATKVGPLLESKCLACHGKPGKKLKGGLNLASRAKALAGGESGDPALVPGQSKNSLLYRAVTRQDEDLEMPPKENDRLTATEVELLRQWIDAGAPWPSGQRRRELVEEYRRQPVNADGVLVETSGGLSPEWTHRRYDPEALWAFKPVRKPEVPRVVHGAVQPRHPIDAFIARRLEKNKLAPAARADKSTLLRRATFDLTGLAPTPDEIAGFLADDSPGAFETVIDRLLASPRYGEQWGRHWLDVVRYADSSGYSNDFERPSAWRYRDYVIRSFNADKPYDRFVLEQLAGDELEPDNPEMLIAVGFLRMGPWEHTGMSVATVARQLYLDDVTNIVGQTFLAQALGCARCHDHKFDPIPTRDYYRIQAIFAPVQLADRRVPFLDAENTRRFAEEERIVKRRANSRGLIGIENTDDEKTGIRKVTKKRKAYLARALNRFKPYALSIYNGPLKVQRTNLAIMRMPAKRRGKPQAVSILSGGSIAAPLEQVSPGVLSSVSGPGLAEAAGVIPETIQGRRLAFARWITSAANPFTARVMVNRIWQHHFGKGLAANPNGFGKMGGRPSHPELLDWLAREFVQRAWSQKAMHKLIMSSETYRRASTHPDPAAVDRADPNGELLSHMRPRRLSAEELADVMLQVSGELQTEMGGIPVHPEINMEVALQPRHVMGSVAPAYQPSRTPEQRNRRTIYAVKIRTLRDPKLEVFDQPSTDNSCERRESSTVTPQVFSLFNSHGSHDRALAFAARLEREAKTLPLRIDRAFQLAFGRVPTEAERQSCIAHVERMTRHHAANPPKKVDPPGFVIREMVEEMTGSRFRWKEILDVYQHDYVQHLKPWNVGPETRALADVCLVLFNSNEFIYVY